MPFDRKTLEAALIGYQAQKEKLDQAMADIRRQLGGKSEPNQHAGVATPERKRRTMSTAARKRIAAAQRKRWADYHATHSKG